MKGEGAAEVQGDNSIKGHREYRKKEALKEVDNAFNIQHA